MQARFDTLPRLQRAARSLSEPRGRSAVFKVLASQQSDPSTDDLSCVTAGDAVVCTVEDGALPVSATPPPPLDLLSGTLLVLPFLLWGTSMVAMKILLTDSTAGLTPLSIAAVRLLPSGLLLVFFAAASGRKQPAGLRAWASVALFGLVDGAVFQGCLAEGLQRTSAGLGSVIIDSQPLTVAVLAALLFAEPITRLNVAGLLLGVLGLLVLELPAGFSLSLFGGGADASLWSHGEWWMLISAQAMALGTCFVRTVTALGVDPVMATGWHMVIGGVPLLALSMSREPDLYARISAEGLSSGDLVLLAYSSVLGGAVAYGLFFIAASKGSLIRLSSLTFLTPMFAAATGFAVLHETLTPMQLLGAAITLVGVYFVNVRL